MTGFHFPDAWSIGQYLDSHLKDLVPWVYKDAFTPFVIQDSMDVSLIFSEI